MTEMLTNGIFIPTMCSQIGFFLVNVDSHPISNVHWTSSSKFNNETNSLTKAQVMWKMKDYWVN